MNSPVGTSTGQASVPGRHWSVRTVLIWLVLACLLPGVIGAAGLFFVEYRNGRAKLEKDTLQTARALSLAVDSQLHKALAVAQSLSTDDALAARSFVRFRQRARQVLDLALPGAYISVSDESGRQMVNSVEPPDGVLSPQENFQHVRQVFASGQPAISDIYMGRLQQRPVASVSVPVAIGGRNLYVLSVAIPPELLTAILQAQNLPEQWIAAVFDSTGTIVARNRPAEGVIGQKAPPNLLQRLMESSEGSLDTVLRDGTPVFAVYSRSPASRWQIGIGIPRQSLEAELRQSLALLALGIASLFALGLCLAWGMGGRIARSFQALTEPAAALGAGQGFQAPEVHVREAEEVAGAMGEAARLLEQRTAALVDSERRYSALFNNKTSAIAHLRIITDADGQPVDYIHEALNDACEQISGIPNSQVLGKRLTEAFPGLGDAGFDAIREYGRIGLEGGEGCFEEYFPPSNQWFSIHAFSPKRGEVIVILTDKTAQKAMELTLAHERERLSTIIQNIPVMLCHHDASFRCFGLNRHFEEVLGWTIADADCGDFMAKVFPDPEARAEVLAFMEKPTPGWRQFHVTAKDGSVVTSEWANVALSDDSRVGIGIDLRERKQVENRLAIHAQRQALLLEVVSGILQAWDGEAEMADALFRTVAGHLDADVCFNYWVEPASRRLELIAGIGIAGPWQEEMRTLALGQAFCGTTAATGECLVADRRRIEIDERGELLRRLGVGAYMGHPLRGMDGQVIGTLSLGSTRRDSFEPEEVDFLRTIAYFLSLAWERLRAELEIRRLNTDLETRVEERTAQLVAANRELEGFTFATSHDLRGPLGRINSFSSLLEQQYRDKLEGDGLLFLDFIRQNATRLILLVDDLLEHARVTRQALEFQPVDMTALVKTVLEENAQEIQDSGAAIRMDLAPALALGDSHALFQALGNLVQNALKYAAAARPPLIEIGGEKTGKRYCLWIRDNGIGFDMAYHDRIFEMFRRLHTYQEYQGNGVGLALVKRAMERLGGRVWAESEPGKGATFFLELELA